MATPSQVIIEPYRNFRFLVEIDGFASAGFNKATGLKIATDVIEYREGGENATVRKLPGQTKFDPIVFERGATANTDFINWVQKIHKYGTTPGLYIARKTITIVLIGNEGKRLKEYTLQNCWPSEWEQGELDAKGNDVLIERLTVQHEGILLVGTPQPDNLITV
jgi:phage tail-like protein